MSEAGAIAADSGPLTVEQAVAAMTAAEAKETPEAVEPVEVTPPAPAGQEAPEAEPAAEGDGEAETPNADEGAEEVEAETPIEPPQFWKAEAKDRFRELPRDLQEIVLAQETDRNAFTSKAAQTAAEAGKAADAEKSKLVTLNEQLAVLVPRADKIFQDRWANVDWVQVTEQFGAQEAQKLRFQYENERDELSRVKAAQSLTEKASFEKFRDEESRKLATEVPELVDPKEGAKRRQDLGEYLIRENGISEQAIQGMTAAEAKIAWKALQWDRSQAKAKELAAQPKTAVPAQRPASRPSAAPGGRNPQSQALVAAQNAFNASPTLENATRLELAQMQR